jgi:exodeoxyribonuclease V alpha subunit
MNGDMGVVIRIDVNDDEENVLVCRFGDHDVTYTQDELKELGLAYAITIHKSQGGQAPVVIMPISTSHYIMLARNLVYTGITRAEKICVMIGTRKALAIAVRNDQAVQRNTRLGKRILSRMKEGVAHERHRYADG